jgi:YebC/PmpR family DNA-binding regulatory protein
MAAPSAARNDISVPVITNDPHKGPKLRLLVACDRKRPSHAAKLRLLVACDRKRPPSNATVRISHMSGHSKWATTKHKKAVVDARRGKLFAKLIKNIEVAARMGGADPAGNPTLYDAIQKAKKNSVPNDNIDRAVKRGSGAEGGGANYETLMYEAYGPAGVALLIECLTDNRNRSASDVRVAVTRNGGTMADAGSTARMFTRKGVVIVAKQQDGRSISEDDLLEATLDADPEEINDLGDSFEIITDSSNTVPVRTAVQQAGLDYESAEVSFVPDYTQEVDAGTAEKLMRIIDALEDSDDVQNVYANFDVSDEVLARIS